MIPKDESGSISDGSYSLEVLVENGEISYGAMYSYAYKDLKFDKEKLELEVEKLKKEPAAKPVRVFEKVKEKPTKEELAKMTNYEITKNKLGI